MANQKLVNLLRADVKEWNDLRRLDPDRVADLIGADLRRPDLSGADLSDADLIGVELQGLDLTSVDLTGANLNGADLKGANLRKADLKHANVTGANFTNADIGATIFVNVNLFEALNLEKVHHTGPSPIDVFTLFKSRGKIPEVFLRGAGVPETLISYLPSLIESSSPIEYYSCFISHSHKDDAFAKHLHARLQENKVRVWFAPEEMKGGKKLYDQIDQAIRLHDKLILVLSDHSIRSEWVMTEIRRARQSEVKEKRQMLFPIRLTDFQTLKEWTCFDADTGKDLAVEIREYFIPDFSNWTDPKNFDQALNKLLEHLKK